MPAVATARPATKSTLSRQAATLARVRTPAPVVGDGRGEVTAFPVRWGGRRGAVTSRPPADSQLPVRVVTVAPGDADKRPMTESRAVERAQDGTAVAGAAGEDIAAPHLAAIQHVYEEAIAGIASLARSSSHPAPPSTDPEPDTKEIDLRTVKPPLACTGPRSERDTASCPREPAALAAHPDTDPSAAPHRRRRRRPFLRKRSKTHG